MGRVLGRDAVVQSAHATYSTHGATSLPQVGAVSESWEQRRDIKRQLPLPVSKKSERRKGSRVIQFNNHASIDGLIVSSKSRARLSRFFVSTWIKPITTSKPHAHS